MNRGQSEVYPMSMFPTFEVTDVRASIDWYSEVLGFIVIYEMPDSDGQISMVHLRREKYQDVILVAEKDHEYDHIIKKGAGVAITFQYSGLGDDPEMSLDDFASMLREAGADVLEGPVNRPWNTREIVVSDPDGYRLVFTATYQKTRKKDFQETMPRVRGSLFKSN